MKNFIAYLLSSYLSLALFSGAVVYYNKGQQGSHDACVRFVNLNPAVIVSLFPGEYIVCQNWILNARSSK